MHLIAGNHEYNDIALFESRYGDTYRYFRSHGDLFIILDPNIDNWSIKGAQLTWLQNLVHNEAGRSRNIFVFFHQLMWYTSTNIYGNYAPNSTAGRVQPMNFFTEVEPLFTALDNNVVMMAGDMGAFNNGREFLYHKYHNITLIGTGMGGGVRDNIVVIDIKEDGAIQYRLTALNGSDREALGILEHFLL